MNNNGEPILSVDDLARGTEQDIDSPEREVSGTARIPDVAADAESYDDQPPEDGDVLLAGDYFIEIETQKFLPREVLTEGFRQIGFAEILIDASAQGAPRTPRTLHRFVGRLAQSITLHQTHAHARFLYARKLETDVMSELKLKFVDHPLTSGKIYESRFLSRMRSQPTRSMVETDLKEMGWDVLKLSALRRDMRIPGRQNASVTLWFAVLRWRDVDSYVSEDDPFYFEDVCLSSSGILAVPDTPRDTPRSTSGILAVPDTLSTSGILAVPDTRSTSGILAVPDTRSTSGILAVPDTPRAKGAKTRA